MYNDAKHKYFVGDRPVPSVTTICGVIGKGDALTQWAVNAAISYLKDRLIGHMTAEEMDAAFQEAKYAYRRTQQDALTVGTLAHNWIEQHLLGNTQPMPENEQARSSCEAALKWLEAHSWKTVSAERRIYSREHHYAGTLDYLAYIDGKLVVSDWKTSKRLYDEYTLQLSAYVQALKEEGVETEGRWLIRIDKETGEFEEKFLSPEEQASDLKAFLGALAIWEHKQSTAAKVKAAGWNQ